MQITTSRFGLVEIEAEDILLFSQGLVGFEQHRHWVLLADANNHNVAWLQCVSAPDTALAVVSPRKFAPEYRVRVAAADLTPLELGDDDQRFVLTAVGKNDGALTVNLRAPIIINLNRRLGRQVIVRDEQPLHYEIAPAAELRKSA